MRYPETRKGDVVDVYGATRVADPYRWLEDLDSPDVAAWVAAQNAVTFAHLETLPHREHLKRRLTELWDYPRTSLPVIENGRLFYAKNSGLQRQSPLYVRTGVFDPPSLVIDPNLLSPDGSISLAQYAPSPDAQLVAYAIAEGGADWETLRVRNVATGEDLSDVVSLGALLGSVVDARLKGLLLLAVSRTAGRQGPRSRAVRPGHLLPPRRHAAVRRRPDLSAPGSSGLDRQRDGQRRRPLRFHPHLPRRRQQQPAALHRSRRPGEPKITAPIKPIVETIDAEFTPIGNYQTRVYLRSDKDAPNRRIIAIDLEHVERDGWKVVVPEQPHAIENAALIGGRLVVHSLVDVQSRIQLFALDGTHEGEFRCPASAPSPISTAAPDATIVWFTFSSPLAPPTVYRYDLESRLRIAV